MIKISAEVLVTFGIFVTFHTNLSGSTQEICSPLMYLNALLCCFFLYSATLLELWGGESFVRTYSQEL